MNGTVSVDVGISQGLLKWKRAAWNSRYARRQCTAKVHLENSDLLQVARHLELKHDGESVQTDFK